MKRFLINEKLSQSKKALSSWWVNRENDPESAKQSFSGFTVTNGWCSTAEELLRRPFWITSLRLLRLGEVWREAPGGDEVIESLAVMTRVFHDSRFPPDMSAVSHAVPLQFTHDLTAWDVN